MIKIVKTTSTLLHPSSYFVSETDSYFVVETDDDGEHHILKKFGGDYEGASDYWWSLLTDEEQDEWLECHPDLACEQ